MMIDLLAQAADLQTFLEETGWDFYFIGGLAVQVWGQPRLTQDIDLTVFTNLKDESAYIETLLERYSPKFSDANEFALTNRVLPMFAENGIGIDVTLGGISDTSEALRRSTYQQFTPAISLRICSADDLVIMKTVANRLRDWMDVEAIVIKQLSMDWEYITSTLQNLSDFEDISARMEKLLHLKTAYSRS